MDKDKRFEKVYFHWLENIKDWCISRQLWWGHRIPAWYCADCGEITVSKENVSKCAHCGSTNIEQDPDTLDTWFSSALWPFSTLGWPDKDAECIGDYVFCYGLKDHFGILSDGRVVPCCLDADGEITLGNIFNDKIEDILASERARSIVEGFKTRHAPESLCQRCGYARRFK